MSVKAKPMPAERTILGVLDREARASVKAAQSEIAPIVAREVPRRSGKTAAALRPRVMRTASGASLSVGAGRARHGAVTVAQVVRWVNRGTGLHRTTGLSVQGARRIRSKRPLGRMTLPGGKKVWSVKGQRPQPFMVRIHQIAGPRVQRRFAEGARDAADAVAKELA